MSSFFILMIAGWSATAAMIALCALNESGKLRKTRQRTAEWLEEGSADCCGSCAEGATE
jgi:hypothetical protein